MIQIAFEQARLRSDEDGRTHLQACSSGFHDDWLPDVERIVEGFGSRIRESPWPGRFSRSR